MGVAGYPRAPVPVTVADPLLATPMMQAMYPALIGHTHPSAAHPVMGVAGHGPGGTDIGVPPSYHLHTADASIGVSHLGVMCVVTGIVLAALHAAGNSFLFLAIMFIGLGVLLVIVVAVGWKCTPRGHEPLHALFSIGDFRNGRRERRTHRHRHRDGNWYGGMMYPEFQYRRPPPTYAASMQEYNSQLALAQANNNNSLANTSASGNQEREEPEQYNTAL
nr:hypothetical protein BaRGS_009691 [Batillaria attramentaria]